MTSNDEPKNWSTNAECTCWLNNVIPAVISEHIQMTAALNHTLNLLQWHILILMCANAEFKVGINGISLDFTAETFVRSIS